MRFLLALAGMAVLTISPAAAQAGAAKESIVKPNPAPRQPKIQQQKQPKPPQPKMVPLPAPAVERFLQMSPEDRERALSKLAPERRQQVEERLNRLQQLPPDQIQRLQDVYPAFVALRPARRQVVRDEIQQLRQMRPALRKDRLNADARDFSPEEMSILRQVTGIPE